MATRVTDPDEIRRLVAIEPRAGVPTAVVDLLARSGAILSGHFKLKNGEHSPYYLRFAQIGKEHELVDTAARLLVECTPIDLEGATILCPESSGFFVANAIARRLGADVAITRLDVRRQPSETLRAGHIDPSRRVVVVNDVVMSGASLEPLIKITREAGAQIAGVLVFAALSDSRFKQLLNRHDLAATWLVSGTWRTWPADQCPQCVEEDELLPAAELS